MTQENGEYSREDSGEGSGMEQEAQYETSSEKVTGFSKGGGHPGVFNRKRVLVTLACSFAVVVLGGVLLNTGAGSGSRRARDAEPQARATAARPAGFLQSQLNRANAALQNRGESPESASGEPATTVLQPILPASEFPIVAWNDSPAARFVPPPPQAAVPAPPPPPPPAGAPHAPPPRPTHYSSPLVPRIEGRLIAANSPGQANPPTPATSPVSLNSPPPGQQNPFSAGQAGFGANTMQSAPTFAAEGHFIADDSLWIGTIIPAVLVTAINTDLPGNILARVTENIFDSRTGRTLLIPQGTILFARYNSDISFAQSRVQIAWDTLIRPDGFQLDLGGMDGVDRRGMAGQEAVYRENWFRYLQAAGLIAMFSIANARMTEEAGRHASEAVAGSIAQSNAEFMSQVSGTIIGRAMNIQPTLTVDSGTSVNVMINRTISLPPLNPFPVLQRHRLE